MGKSKFGEGLVKEMKPLKTPQQAFDILKLMLTNELETIAVQIDLKPELRPDDITYRAAVDQLISQISGLKIETTQ